MDEDDCTNKENPSVYLDAPRWIGISCTGGMRKEKQSDIRLFREERNWEVQLFL